MTLGDLEEFNLCTDRATHQSKGFGFVVFRSVRDAEECLRARSIPIEVEVAWESKE